MNARRALELVLALALAGTLTAACSGGDEGEGGDDDDGTGFVTPTPDVNAHEYVQTAQVTYPRLIDLQTKVFSNTCSPNPNVCHNSSNYPQLATAGSTMAVVDSPCNVEIPDRTQGWNNCERKADHIKAGIDVNTRVAWIDQIGPQTWKVGLEEAPLITGDRRPELYDAQGGTILNPPADDSWGVTIALVAGTAEAMVTVAPMNQDEFLSEFVDAVLATVVGGDPNEDGVWGADEESVEPGALVVPGSLDRSYLWGRITGTVPGFRMPLANTPITNPGYVAIACWIEGLSNDGSERDPDDLIDYDNCQYADAPIDYATTE